MIKPLVLLEQLASERYYVQIWGVLGHLINVWTSVEADSLPLNTSITYTEANCIYHGFTVVTNRIYKMNESTKLSRK